MRKKEIIDRKLVKLPSDNTIIIQIHKLLTYRKQNNLKSFVSPISLTGASSGST